MDNSEISKVPLRTKLFITFCFTTCLLRLILPGVDYVTQFSPPDVITTRRDQLFAETSPEQLQKESLNATADGEVSLETSEILGLFFSGRENSRPEGPSDKTPV